MKKLYLSEASLMSSKDARLTLGPELQAVKISLAEMMDFKGNFNSFEEILAKYGSENRLKPGEQYRGYLAVCYAPWYQLPMWLCGSLKKAGWEDVRGKLRSEILLPVDKGEYWVLSKYSFADGRSYNGAFRQMKNFTEDNFCKHIVKLQSDQNPIFDCLREINPEEMSSNIKKRIFDGAVARAPFILTNEEYLVLEDYFGPVTLRGFFSVWEE